MASLSGEDCVKYAEVIDYVESTRIIAILRGRLSESFVEIAGAMIEGGVRALEVSTVTPGFSTIIRELVSQFPHCAIGAGTVLTLDQLKEAADAGSCFIVSPNSDAEIIAMTRSLELVSFPGAYTATEVVQARRCGADAVKLFPAVSLGPEYVRALRGPLPNLKLIPTGGINTSNLATYLSAGAWAVGVGSELISKRDMEHPDTLVIAHRTQEFIAAAKLAGKCIA
jgi:Entner-Doudoroff aldolase